MAFEALATMHRRHIISNADAVSLWKHLVHRHAELCQGIDIEPGASLDKPFSIDKMVQSLASELCSLVDEDDSAGGSSYEEEASSSSDDCS